jgi:DNA-3-methyladenine glycosylase II
MAVPLRTASGPIDLAFAGRFLAGWPPATHGGTSADGALRLAFVRDDLEGAGGVTLRPGAAGDAVSASLAGGATQAQVRRVFSLDLDGDAFAALGERDAELGALQARVPRGARPVLFGAVYEAAAWAVIGARMPAARAAAVKRALVAQHGAEVELDGEVHRAFPAPRTLLAVDAVPGLPGEKVRRLHGVAQAALEGTLDASALAALPTDAALARLKTIRGIGDFYAMLVLLRAVGVTDVLPAELRFAEIAAAAQRWSPFRTWAAFLLRAGGV